MPSDRTTRKYLVATQDGDSLIVEATDPKAAAEACVESWGIEADPGYPFFVFDLTDATKFVFALAVVPAEDD